MRSLLPLAFVLALGCTDGEDDNPADQQEDTDEPGGGGTPGGDTDGDTDEDDELNTDDDRDGLTLGRELKLETDPNNPDTDDDDLSDGQEVDVWRTDPLSPDTDNDGMTDGEEVDRGADPLDPDTDDDGVLDGAELLQLTDPLNPDSDFDGLGDGDEPTTDPANWDTDGDGLPDGMEVLNPDVNTDPNDPDTDDDGITDFDEVFVWGSNPTEVDTDQDGLEDGDEVAAGTDLTNTDTDDDGLSDFTEVVEIECVSPLIRDTDGGGAPDGLEVLTDLTDPCDPSDDLCIYVYNVDVDDVNHVPAGPDFDPSFVRFHTTVLKSRFGPEDFWIDADLDTRTDDNEIESAAFVMDILGPRFEHLCSVTFEVDNATELSNITWTADGGGTLFEAWSLADGVGATDCPSLDTTVYNNEDDIRDLLGTLDLGFAFGSLGGIADRLQDSVEADPDLDWENDWAPHVYGSYITWDGDTAYPLNYAFLYESACDSVSLDNGGQLIPEAAATEAPLSDESLRVSSPFDVVSFYDVTGIECEGADLDISDPAWSADPQVVSAALFGSVHFYGGILPNGEITDYYEDVDGDGILDEQSARIVFQVRDANQDELCSIEYDASAATPVDPTSYGIFDTDGNTAGPITYAYELTLENGTGDCGSLDTDLGWTNSDPEVLLEGLTDFAFGVGPLSTQLDGFGPLLFTDWTTDGPNQGAFYASLDGIDFFNVAYVEMRETENCAELTATGAFPYSEVEDGAVGVVTHTQWWQGYQL